MRSEEVRQKSKLVRCFRLPKGRGKYRLLFVFSPRAKKVLVGVSRLIQSTIPATPTSLAYEQGCSVNTAVRLLTGHKVVCTLDIRDHFGSVIRKQVKDTLIAAGYQEDIAWFISRLTCIVYRGRDFLPQGSPASPFLANRACEFLIDNKVREAIPPGAEYYRYSDNLFIVSQDACMTGTQVIKSIQEAVATSVKWKIHKCRVMPWYRSQRGLGVVLNSAGRMPRPEFDTLKAVLHCFSRDRVACLEKANTSGYIQAGTVEELALKLAAKLRYWSAYMTPAQVNKLTTYLEG